MTNKDMEDAYGPGALGVLESIYRVSLFPLLSQFCFSNWEGSQNGKVKIECVLGKGDVDPVGYLQYTALPYPCLLCGLQAKCLADRNLHSSKTLCYFMCLITPPLNKSLFLFSKHLIA